jgi:GlpG protein
MSGVNYALFGYIWMRGKLDPGSGFGVSPQTAMWMLVWFVLCWTGFVGPIANWNHAGGLAAGVGLGALAAARRR